MPDFHQGTLVVTQPPHFPTMHTRETVTHLAAFGLDENQVAVILKCTPDDVRRYYTNEMEHGLTRVNSQVMSAVLHAALYNDSAQDRKLWLINKAGWRAGDAQRASLPNGADGPLPEGEMTVVQRRDVITRVLTIATQSKRQAERVIEAEVVQKPNGKTNGHGPNGTNGAGGGNGVKHK